MKLKKSAALILAASFILGTAACSSSSSEAQTETESETAQPLTIAESDTETEAPTETETAADDAIPEGMMRSYLTGELVDEEVGSLKPFAIMINNHTDALPMSGVSQAEIIYEAEVEGGITRLMAIFQDIEDVEKIGSVRSARHYYLDFAHDNEAIYCHYGWSQYAQNRIQSEGIKTMNGLTLGDGTVYYRSSDRVAPHNVYTSGERLISGAESLGISREYPEGYTGRFTFNTEDTKPEGETADSIYIALASNVRFEYNAEDGLYYRYQHGYEHCDRENGDQLAFKNVIVQFVDMWTISSYGHQDMTLNGEGSGYYFTDGVAVPVTWKRADNSDYTMYYDSDGNEITLNTGKTMFEIIRSSVNVSYE
ncbi:MAG: DUF3048 domain-containing protein [Lachnospiraceae bacterium]|nr:DUF3048 domain-containing protein [Lachnospiraceae bacterium]